MTRHRSRCVLGLTFLLASVPATAATHHRHASPALPPASLPSSFYPEKVEGGVAGNLPFNNQVRKHTDPLNANGSK